MYFKHRITTACLRFHFILICFVCMLSYFGAFIKRSRVDVHLLGCMSELYKFATAYIFYFFSLKLHKLKSVLSEIPLKHKMTENGKRRPHALVTNISILNTITFKQTNTNNHRSSFSVDTCTPIRNIVQVRNTIM